MTTLPKDKTTIRCNKT